MSLKWHSVRRQRRARMSEKNFDGPFSCSQFNWRNKWLTHWARSQITASVMSSDCMSCILYSFWLLSVTLSSSIISWWPVSLSLLLSLFLSPISPPLADSSTLITSQASERTPLLACTTWICCEYFCLTSFVTFSLSSWLTGSVT